MPAPADHNVSIMIVVWGRAEHETFKIETINFSDELTQHR